MLAFLRFLWWPEGDWSKEPIEYRMLVHLFGATSSPSCANYALKKTAEDNKDCFPPIVCDTVHHNFYVDDCLKSLPSKEEAMQMVQDLASMLQKGSSLCSPGSMFPRFYVPHLPPKRFYVPQVLCSPPPLLEKGSMFPAQPIKGSMFPTQQNKGSMFPAHQKCRKWAPISLRYILFNMAMKCFYRYIYRATYFSFFKPISYL